MVVEKDEGRTNGPISALGFNDLRQCPTADLDPTRPRILCVQANANDTEEGAEELTGKSHGRQRFKAVINKIPGSIWLKLLFNKSRSRRKGTTNL